MTSKELEKLGEPLYRTDTARSRKEGGAGLGISICQQIVYLHHATLSYRSVPNQGTTAFVEFTTS